MAAPRDPIEPARTFVSMLAAFVVALAAIGLLNALNGYGPMWGMAGDGNVCVDARHLGGSVDTRLAPMPPFELASGVQVGAGTVSLCTSTPTGGQRVLEATAEFPGFLVLAGTLVLAMSLFRLIRREGLFTTRAVARMRLVGWFVILGNLVASLAMAFAGGSLVQSMLRYDLGGGVWLGLWDMPVMAVLLGTVLVSVARILGVSTAMRKDLEGTV